MFDLNNASYEVFNKKLNFESHLFDLFVYESETTKNLSSFKDKRNYPFYYFLGKELNPENVLMVGNCGGYKSGFLCYSSKNIKNLYVYDILNNSSLMRITKNNLGKFRNVKKCFFNDIKKESFLKENFFDLIIFDDVSMIDEKDKLYFFYDICKKDLFLVFYKIFDNKKNENYLINFANKRNTFFEKFQTRNQTLIIKKI